MKTTKLKHELRKTVCISCNQEVESIKKPKVGYVCPICNGTHIVEISPENRRSLKQTIKREARKEHIRRHYE